MTARDLQSCDIVGGHRPPLHWLALILFAILVSCKGPATETSTTTKASSPSNANASVNKDDYPVFPDADAGADPSVPAEQGGRGFKGDGWETNTDFDLIGDPRAVK